jgi:hypothetical protein
MSLPWYVAEEMEKRDIAVTQPVYKKRIAPAKKKRPRTPAAAKPVVPSWTAESAGMAQRGGLGQAELGLPAQRMQFGFGGTIFGQAPQIDVQRTGLGFNLDPAAKASRVISTPSERVPPMEVPYGAWTPKTAARAKPAGAGKDLTGAYYTYASLFGSDRGLPGGYNFEGAFDVQGNLINIDQLPNMMTPWMADVLGLGEDWRSHMYGGPEDNFALRPRDDLMPDEIPYGGQPYAYGGYPTYTRSYPGGGGRGGGGSAYPWGLVSWRYT